MKKKTILLNTCLLILSLIFCLFLVECQFRVFSDNALPESANKSPFVFTEYDPLLGWKKIPNKSGRSVTEEYDVLVSVNSNGIRGPEYSYDKKENEYRILILGDSFAHGYSVEFDKLFSEVLKRELNRKDHKYYEVINAGTIGYSTDQELLFFQKEGIKYNPNLTILMFCDNDPWYNSQTKYNKYYKPLFRFKNGAIHLANIPVPEPDPVTKKEPAQKTIFRGIKDWLNYNSHSYIFVRDRMAKNHYLLRLAIKLGLSEAYHSAQLPDLYRVFLNPYDSEVSETWEITEAILYELKKEVTSINSNFVVFYIPTQSNIYNYERFGNSMSRQYGIEEKNWNSHNVINELQQVAIRNSIDLVNPVELFRTQTREHKQQGERLYFKKDGHWTERGNEFVGEILASYIRSNILRK